MVWRFARQLIENEKLVILDTETTGLGGRDEVVQVAVIDRDGQVLVDTLVQPAQAAISREAYNVHRISPAMVADAPTLLDIWSQLHEALAGKTVAVYNVDFDRRLLKQSALANEHKPTAVWLNGLDWVDVMEPYRRLYKSRQWQKLTHACYQQSVAVEDAHSALGDCRMVLALLRKLGGYHE